ncbi:MAG: RNA-binding transcriptional accessory protein [Polyangiaceae bacterium]|nr:RNA-binding transcriptional accessory protein [Polyangiaceae bacterium]
MSDSNLSPSTSTLSSTTAAPLSAPGADYDPLPAICAELSLPESGVRAVVNMMNEGATVPFIARYRKEATGGLDEVQIRAIGERRSYLLELETRRRSILGEIQKQGKLTDALKKKIASTSTKAELEDLYLPYKPKRRTRGMIAKERGLEPLAELIWQQGLEGEPAALVRGFIQAEKEVPDEKSAWSGARDIVAERLAEDAENRKLVRTMYLEEGVLHVNKTKSFEDKVTKFDNYAEFNEAVANIASHRYLAVRRGETEGVLRGTLEIDEDRLVSQIERNSPWTESSPWGPQMKLACQEATKRLLMPTAQVDVRVELKMRADKEAIEVFARNLRELLMAPPLGTKAVLGIDPGQRTGCKCVIVDQTGKLLANETIYLVQGESSLQKAEATILSLCGQYPVHAVAVGNGTHGRETEAFIKKLLSKGALPEGAEKPFCISVSESGASIYSASDIAREEFPDLDLTVRGAISIARRLQDPLAELVKLDPKSIGVGQYQHDVYQSFLGKKLDEVVESCVHEVGVELNTASAPLLARVSGLGTSLARRIVDYRNRCGAFQSRQELLKVTGLGPRAFEQAAGFLRIRGAEHPLDSSAVHPERYPLIEKIAADLQVPVEKLIGSHELLTRLDRSRYLSEDVGAFTLDDIFKELLKPGRDPRKSFEAPQFRDDVNSLEDLKIGMSLEGVITNVTAFGAFVDIGVHQDGLVHISQLCDRFIKDPSEVAKVGEKIRVRVVEVDLERNRISLTARSDEKIVPGDSPSASGASSSRGERRRHSGGKKAGSAGRAGSRGQSSRAPGGEKLTHNPFADVLRRS